MQGSKRKVRYRVIPPVTNGYAWWNVIAPVAVIDGVEQNNWLMASFSVHMPGAGKTARDLCARLNGSNRRKKQS